jgi:hypothetical protein
MPKIPTWQNINTPDNRLSPAAVAIPQAPPALRATADVFGGGEGTMALARASEAWSQTAGAFQAARAESTYQNEKLSAIMKIGEFEKGLQTRTDYDQFEPEFDSLIKSTWKDYEERIQDPGVLQASPPWPYRKAHTSANSPVTRKSTGARAHTRAARPST